MKAFLLRLVSFLLLLLAGFVIAFVGVLGLHRSALARCDLGKPVDSILVGDSHGMWSIDDREITGFRNISLNAEGYRYSYGKVLHVLETTPALKTLYISFGYHNLAGYYDDYILGPTFGSYIERYLGILERGDFERFFAHDPWGFPDLVRRAVQRGLTPGLKRECLLYGTFPSERMSAGYRESSMKQRVADQFYEAGHVAGTSAPNAEYLERLIQLGRERGLRVVLLSPPVHREYARLVPAEYQTLVAEFARKHGVEHFAFEDLALGDQHFLPDGDHTNYAGAVLTTKRFREYHESR